MTRIHAVGLAGLLAMTANHAFAVAPAQHTVDWYRTHQQARESVLRTCQNDHTHDDAADCRNATSAIPGQIAGSANTLSSLGQAFYTLNHIFTATGTDAQATLLNRSAISTANIQGIAAANLASIEQRQANLNAMQTALQGATDIKQVAAINGRIAIESNAIQGQQAQAQNLVALASAQAQANQQAALQTIRQGHEQAAAQFTGTLN